MIDKNLIDRINFLANKKKTSFLSEEELIEQKKLREIYLEQFRQGFKEQLLSVNVIDQNGDDVTPEKLKRAKVEREKN